MKLVEGQLIHRRYRLDSRLAQGGMGEVWKGYDIQLGRPVAIKALRGDLGVTQEAKLLRLRAEAHNSANLAHPNIAALFEYYEHDGHRIPHHGIRAEQVACRPVPRAERPDGPDQAAADSHSDRTRPVRRAFPWRDSP